MGAAISDRTLCVLSERHHASIERCLRFPDQPALVGIQRLYRRANQPKRCELADRPARAESGNSVAGFTHGEEEGAPVI
jgi:hypothetical protein